MDVIVEEETHGVDEAAAAPDLGSTHEEFAREAMRAQGRSDATASVDKADDEKLTFDMIEPMGGWLHKTDSSLRKWTKRYFALLPTVDCLRLVGVDEDQVRHSVPCLLYFTGEDTKTLKGEILAITLQQVGFSKSLPGMQAPTPYLIRLETDDRTYFLAAETEDEAADWAQGISDVMHAMRTALAGDYDVE